MKRDPIWPHDPPMAPSRARGILLPAVASAFDALDIGVGLSTRLAWYPVHVAPSVSAFEMAHGVETRRWAYNAKCERRVAKSRDAVLGEHAGFHDLFVPVWDGRELWGQLVAGPFALRSPTKADVLERWRNLTGRHGRAADPDFSHYLAVTLSTLTLDGALFETFKALLGCLARLMVGGPALERMAKEAETLIGRLDDARFAERMWQAASEMIDERTTRTWLSVARGKHLAAMGATRLPTHVVVGLLLGRDAQSDPIDDVLSRDAIQHACVELAKRRGGLVVRRIADHGVALLVDDPGKGPRTRARLSDLAGRLSTLAERHGLRLHAGISAPDDGAALPARYRAALSAAERALAQGIAVARAEPGTPLSHSPLFALRQQLARAARESPNQLSPRFDRYMEAAALYSGYRLDLVRAHVEAGFDELANTLTSSGALDEKGSGELRGSIAQGALEATTVRELMLAYRPVISDLEHALERPSLARQDRSLRRALAFIESHMDEPLGLAKLARIAGFAPRHFAKLFVQSERRTPKRYTAELRVARAKHLLSTTGLPIERIGRLTGLGTRASMHRTFRDIASETPGSYRRKHSPDEYTPPELRVPAPR